MIPHIGAPYEFVPSAYTCGPNATMPAKAKAETRKVAGTIVQINQKHGWFRVAYETDYNGTQHECFKF